MQDSVAIEITSVATGFALAIAAGNRDALLGMLAPDVEFRAVTPSRVWEIDSADDAIATMLGTWFGGERHVEAVEFVETGTIGDTVRVMYRFRATTPAGPALVEQQAYLAAAGDTITAVRIVCSGYHAVGS